MTAPDPGSATGIPLWVKVSGAIALVVILVLLILLVILLTGGDPGGHKPPDGGWPHP